MDDITNKNIDEVVVKEKTIIFTIGHSTRDIKNFLDILKSHEITEVVDIRKIPRSRTNPQFNTETLSNYLSENGIKYIHMSGLSGLRRPNKDSINTGWRNMSFRGFADYIQTEEFDTNLEKLIELTRKERIFNCRCINYKRIYY